MTDTATSRSLRSNTAVMLEAAEAWQVVEGSVAVFDVRLRNGSLTGMRRYLFSCRQGDTLFGSQAGTNGVDHRFLVVGLKNSELQAVPQLRTTQEKPRTDAETWIAKICELLSEDFPRGHADRLEPGYPVTLGDGQSVKPAPRTVLWVQVQEGSVCILGEPRFRVTPESGWIPLNDSVWLTAEGICQVLPKTTDEMAASDVEAGVEQLHRLCFNQVEIKAKAEQDQETHRLEERLRLQELETIEALSELGSTLAPHAEPPKRESELLTALTAIGDVLGVTFAAPAKSENMRRVADPVEAIARASGMRTRKVALTGAWYDHDAGPILAYYEEGKRPVALVRRRSLLGQYYELFDPRDCTRKVVTSEVAGQLNSDAISLIRPLPKDKNLSLWKLAAFGVRPYLPELILLIMLALGVATLGMMIPVATRLVIDEAIPDANKQLLIELSIGLVSLTIGMAALALSQGVVTLRMKTGATAALQSAVLDRVLRLSSKFFQRFSSGDLMNRVTAISTISNQIGATAVRAILAGFMSFLNLGLCYYYSPTLAWVAAGAALAAALGTVFFGGAVRKRAMRYQVLGGKLFGFTVQLVGGISKLRVAGAEQRAFNQWTRRYAEQLRLTDEMIRIQNWNQLLSVTIQTGSLTLLFLLAANMLDTGNIGVPMLTMGTFLAFHSAFLTLLRGSSMFSNTFVNVMDSWAKRELMQPLLVEPVENDENKGDPGRLTGGVALSDVVFRYREDGPMILNEVNLNASPGEFIALVGPSGSGKSTIFRLLLGFEHPESGSVLFDNQDLAGLNTAAVRRQIGTVLQAGNISAGSLFDAIAGSNVVTMEEAWEAARDSGLAEDIEEMPMKMHTVIPEGASTLSGGQRQRLLIARALVTSPKILLLDEATSALDNRTQAIVSRSIERRQVTRIVVAHRLSTIRDADRIYVLEAGRIVQAGNFQELSQEEGLFKRMIRRQMA